MAVLWYVRSFSRNLKKILGESDEFYVFYAILQRAGKRRHMTIVSETSKLGRTYIQLKTCFPN